VAGWLEQGTVEPTRCLQAAQSTFVFSAKFPEASPPCTAAKYWTRITFLATPRGVPEAPEAPAALGSPRVQAGPSIPIVREQWWAVTPWCFIVLSYLGGYNDLGRSTPHTRCTKKQRWNSAGWFTGT
jgi:hypothetical protein